MAKTTIMLIPDKASHPRKYTIHHFAIKLFFLFFLITNGFLGYFIFDYLQLRNIRSQHFRLVAENQNIKGEAQILMTNLEEVKRSLARIKDYTGKLSQIVNFDVNNVQEKTGIGPLSPNEFHHALKNSQAVVPSAQGNETKIPLGINLDKLVFRSAINKLSDVQKQSSQQVLELQQLFVTLSQKKSLLNTIPTISPVGGWITSDFGARVSPFTGERARHNGVDIAASMGAPIYAPADGVVIFSGAKEDFGNFIMIAHYSYGIVTRYGHNAQNMVRIGQKVKKGEQIAAVGMSGRTTGPHLHYEIYVNGVAVNPKKFILEPSFTFLAN